MTPSPIFDQDLIAERRRRARSRASAGADFLLARVGEELVDRLQAVERSFAQALELHGHTGLVADLLIDSGKVECVTRVETHRELLAGAHEGIVSPLDVVPAEAKALDLVVSPLSLHLTNDTPGVLVQICRALKPDGLFLGALPGAGTLAELREALLSAEAEMQDGASPRVIPFTDLRDAGALLQRAGFSLPVVDVETYTVRYDDMFALLRDLRAMGMQNPLLGRSRKPASRGMFLRAAEIYAERFSDPDGRIRASFTIIYLSAWRPHDSQQKPLKPGSAQVSLAEIIGRKSGKT
jgi:SAM-dependent methyltransferase